MPADHPVASAAQSSLSPHAERIMRQLVVVQGLSYDDAIRRCEDVIERANAPYREVADALRRHLGEDGR